MSRPFLMTTTALICLLAAPTSDDAFAQDGQVIDVPSQPLSAAITEFGQETGWAVGAAEELLTNKSSAPVRGEMRPEEALRRLLAGTGLTYSFTGDASVVIRVAQSASQVTSGADEDLIGDDIIVRGELQARTRQDSQTSVAVIRGDDLERRSDPDIFTVVERTPGISQAGGEQAFSIRGVPAFGFAAGRGNGQAVATVVDGASLSNVSALASRNPLSTWDLEQIEILRGPQSTQTGRNALFGVVNLQSKDPSYDFEFKMRGEVGNFETVGGAFAVNLPYEEYGLALRFSGDFQHTDGFIENITVGLDDAGAQDNGTLRAGLLFEPTDDFSATLKFFHTTSTTGEFRASDALFPDQRAAVDDTPFTLDNTINSITLNMNYDLTEELSIQSRTNYFQGTQFSIQDADGTAVPTGAFFRDRDGRNFEQELSLRYESDNIRGVIGGFFADIEEVSGTFSNAGGVLFQSSINSGTRNYAFFGEVEAEVIPDLTLIAGFRYDNERASNRAFSVRTPGAATFFDEETTFSAFLPKAGIAYDITEDLSLGFTAQRGYRAGGLTSNFAGNLNTFDPEKTWNFEGSIRSQWFDDRLTANANFFYTIWRDQQVLQIVPTGPPFFFDVEVTNAGRSRLFGGEIEILAEPTDNLELFASAAYVDTKFIEFVAFGSDFSGNEFNHAPRFTAAAGGTYEFDNGFFLSADASYTQDSFSDTANTISSDARFLVNSRAGYRDENFEVFAFVRNLFDNDYALQRSASGGNVFVDPGEPLTFGVVGQVNF
ncbi:MAG: TonB-dependent receptor [Pseudomonadota bacterium]